MGGEILEERCLPLGIQQVRDGAFADALRTLLGDWEALDAPRIACGMIGSRQGWIEAPYRACPVALPDLAAGLTRTPGGELAIIAGISCRDAAGVPDVMRGEETQVAGLVDSHAPEALVVQPGTHSKWTLAGALPGGGTGIRAFVTFMTGEVFAVMRENSILGRLMQGASARGGASFERGVAHGFEGASSGALLHRLFGARTLALFGELASADVADYLSGVLIGAEIAEGRRWAAAQGAAAVRVVVAGTEELCARYRRALDQAGIANHAAPAGVAAHGLWRLARHAGLVHDGDRP